jgi:hypothetical protein
VIDLDKGQLDAIAKLRNGNVLKGGVGTGKSRTALAYFFLKECRGGLNINGTGHVSRMQTPKDLYIITTAKKRNDLEWEAEAASFGLSSDESISYCGVKVTVDSWNNIDKYKEKTDAFFIFDEQRLVGRGAWVKSFYKIAASNRWILLSATPGDSWGDYVPVFVANGLYKNRTEFERSHVVWKRFSKFPQVDRYIGTETLAAHQAALLVDIPYRRHTVRHDHNVLVEHDKAAYARVTKERWNVLTNQPIKDVSELFALMRKIVNSDVSRYAAMLQLIETHPKLIVFYNFDYELEMLRTLHDVLGITVAEWNGHRHDSVPTDDRWLYLVQYTAGSEGWNCISTDSIVFYSLTYSWRQMEQAKGRIDRRNTPFKDLHYYILRSSASIDVAILRALVTKKNFNERTFTAF